MSVMPPSGRHFSTPCARAMIGVFLDPPDGLEGARGVVQAEDILESQGCPVASVSPPRRSSIRWPHTLSMGEILPGLGHGLACQRGQLEVIGRDSGTGWPHLVSFAGSDKGCRYDLHGQTPLKGPGEQRVADAPVVPAAHQAQDLATVQVLTGRHPPSEASSRLRCRP